MNMKSIVQALQEPNSQVRVSSGDRWLIYDEDTWEWVVYSRGYGQRKTRELYRGRAEGGAVAVLIGEDSGEKNQT